VKAREGAQAAEEVLALDERPDVGRLAGLLTVGE
jgi:hypothetical protein